MSVPLCFVDPMIFKLWSSSGGLNVENCPSDQCTDCLPSYKMKMQRQGMCDHPETKFDIYPEGGLFGYWKAKVQRGPKPKPKVAMQASKPSASFWADREREIRDRMGFGR